MEFFFFNVNQKIKKLPFNIYFTGLFYLFMLVLFLISSSCCIIMNTSNIDNIVIIIRIVYILLYLNMPLYLVFVNLSGMYASVYLQLKYMTKDNLKRLLLLPNTWLLLLQLLISIIIVIVLYTNQVWIYDMITTNFNEFMEARLAQYKIYTVVENENTPDNELKKTEDKKKPQQRKKKFYYSPYFTDFGAIIAQKSTELESTQKIESKESTALLPRILNRIGKALTYGKQNKTISDFTIKTYGSAAPLSWYVQTHTINGVEIGKAYLGWIGLGLNGTQNIFNYLWNPTKFPPNLLKYENGYGSVILPSFKDKDTSLTTFFDPSLKGFLPIIYEDLPGTNYRFQRIMKAYLKVRDHTIDTTIHNPLTDADKKIIRTIVDRQLAGLSLVKFGPSALVQKLGKEVSWSYHAMGIQTIAHHCMHPDRFQELNQDLAKYVFALANYNYSIELMEKDYPITAKGAIEYGTGYALNLYYAREVEFLQLHQSTVASNIQQYAQPPFIQPGVPGVTTPEQYLDAVNGFKTDFYNTPKGPAIYDYCYVLWEEEYYSDWQPFLARIDAKPISCFEKFEQKVELLNWKHHMLLNQPDRRLLNVPTIYTAVEQFIEKYERTMAQVRYKEVYIAEYIRLVQPQTHYDTKLLIQKYSTYSVDELRDLVNTEHKKRNEIIFAHAKEKLLKRFEKKLQQQQNIDGIDLSEKEKEKRIKAKLLSIEERKTQLINRQLHRDSASLVQYQTQRLLEASPEGVVPFTTLEFLIEDIIEEGYLGAPLTTKPIEEVEYVPVVTGALKATDKVGIRKYNIEYNYDPFNAASNYDYILKHWFDMLPAEKKILQKALDKNLKTNPDYQSWLAMCEKGYFKKDDLSVEIPQTDFFIVNGNLFAHGLFPKEMRLFHCNISFPIAMDPDTGQFSWHPYLKLKPARLQVLQELGWENYVQEEIKSNIIECYNTAEHFDYENYTTRRIMVHNQRYTLINNHYLPIHFTREIPLGEYEGKQLVFTHLLNSAEYEWYRKCPLEFPIRYNPTTKTFSWHERLHPERILKLQDARWPEFLAKQLGYPANTRLNISDTQVNLKHYASKSLFALGSTHQTIYPELSLNCESTHPNRIVIQKLLDELWLKPTKPRPRPLEDLCKEIDDVVKNFSWTEAINLQLDFTKKMQTYTQPPSSQPNVLIEGQDPIEVQPNV